MPYNNTANGSQDNIAQAGNLAPTANLPMMNFSGLRGREEFLRQILREQQELFGGTLDSGGMKFSSGPVEPVIAQRVERKIQLLSRLLSKINVWFVPEKKGQKVAMSPSQFVASRTATSESPYNPRMPAYLGSLEKHDYELFQTNYDTAIPFDTISAWQYAAPNFRTLYNEMVAQSIGLARVQIGWNGVSAAPTTNPANMGTDVNRGWIQAIQEEAPERLIGTAATQPTIKIGCDDTGKKLPDADFGSLDAAVFDLHMTLMNPAYQQMPDMVCIVGKDLWNRYNTLMFELAQARAVDRLALEKWMSMSICGGLPLIMEPYFPLRGILITSYKNLSLYIQDSSIRMAQEIEHKFNRITNWRSGMEGFVVEWYDMCAGALGSSVLLPDGKGGWA